MWPITRHPFGFTQFVTSLHAKFCSGPVVSLWPGWIVQLICISLAWRTHALPLLSSTTTEKRQDTMRPHRDLAAMPFIARHVLCVSSFDRHRFRLILGVHEPWGRSKCGLFSGITYLLFPRSSLFAVLSEQCSKLVRLFGVLLCDVCRL